MQYDLSWVLRKPGGEIKRLTRDHEVKFVRKIFRHGGGKFCDIRISISVEIRPAFFRNEYPVDNVYLYLARRPRKPADACSKMRK